MVKIDMTMHPNSLHPLEAARAYNMRYEEQMSWKDIAADTFNLQGDSPSMIYLLAPVQGEGQENT